MISVSVKTTSIAQIFRDVGQNTYTAIRKSGVFVFFFLKEIIQYFSLARQGRTKLISRDSKDFYIKKRIMVSFKI